MNSMNMSHESWLAQFDQTDPQTGQKYRVTPHGGRVYLATRPFFGGGAGILIPFRPRSSQRRTPPASGASGDLRASCGALDAAPKEAEEHENSEGS